MRGLDQKRSGGRARPSLTWCHPLPVGVPDLPHDAPQPLQLQRPPAHAQEPAPPRLPRVRGQLPASQLPGPPPGSLPAFLSPCGIQVPAPLLPRVPRPPHVLAGLVLPGTSSSAGLSRAPSLLLSRSPRSTCLRPMQWGEGPLELQLCLSRPPWDTGCPQPLLPTLGSALPRGLGRRVRWGALRCLTHHSISMSFSRCPSCAVVFGGVNSIKSHIQTSHCEVFHKCPICPMAFKSAPSAHAHLYTQHPSFHTQQAK